MNILVHAYQTAPNMGSEFSVAWNYIMQMSKKHNLYVLVGQTSYFMNDFSNLDKIEVPNVRFIKVESGDFISRLLNLFYKKSFSSPTFYLYYRYWEYRAYKYAKKLGVKFDVVHQLGPIGYREPGYLHKLKCPFIWGPIGGITLIKKEFLRHYSGVEKLKGFLKNLLNYIQFNYTKRIHKVFKRADCLIAATTEQQKLINDLLKNNKCLYFPENVLKDIPSNNKIIKNHKDKIHIVWIGSFESRKMPFLFIDSINKVIDKSEIIVSMIGTGRLYSEVQTIIKKKEMQNINLTGSLSRREVMEILKSSDLLVITSAVEANTTIVWEAMEYGIPIITLDHCGMKDIVKDGITGFKIPVSNYEKMSLDIAAKINFFVENRNIIDDFKINMMTDSKNYVPAVRINFFENCYKIAIENFCKKNKSLK